MKVTQKIIILNYTRGSHFFASPCILYEVEFGLPRTRIVQWGMYGAKHMSLAAQTPGGAGCFRCHFLSEHNINYIILLSVSMGMVCNQCSICRGVEGLTPLVPLNPQVCIDPPKK